MTHRLPLGPMAVVVAALVTGLVGSFLVGAFAPEITADLGTGPAVIGRAVSAFFLTAAVSSVFGGRIVDRVGARTGYRMGLAAVATSGLVAGLLVRSGWQLVAALAIGGAAIAFIDPSIARTITGSVDRSRQGIAFGVKETAVAVASMTAGFALPLLAGRATWQVPFLAIAVVAVMLALVIPAGIDPGHRPVASTPPLAVPDPPAPHPAAPSATEVATDPQHEPAAAARPRPVVVPVVPGRPGRALALLAVSAGLAGGAGAVVATYLVTAGVSAGLASGSAALLLSLGSIVSIGVRLAAGWQADRLPRGPLPLLAGLLVAGAVGVASLALAASLAAGAGTEVAATPGVVVLLLAVGAVLALGPGWGWSALVFLVAVRFVPGRPAQASGAMLAGLGGGGAVFPLLAGILIERVGFVTTWSAVAACMALAAALAILLHRRTQPG
ncbi:MAG: MFS transporter [Nitriliruptoraceae bacterium]